MADENIIDIIVRGAEQAIRQITGVSQSQQDLARVQEQVAQQQVRSYSEVAKAAEQAAAAQEDAARRAAEAAKEAAKVTVNQTTGRARFTETGQFASQGQTQLSQRSAVVASSSIANLGGLSQRIAAAQQGANQQAAAQTAATTQSVNQQVAALKALAQAAQQAAAAQNLNTQAGRNAASQLLNTARAANAQAAALSGVINQSSRASGGGITYLSVLSAIHAASFLATNQTFSMVGSFITLGAAFGKLGLVGAGAGLALGAILGVFGQITEAARQLQANIISGAETLVKFGAGVAAAAVAAGVAGVKIAGSFETQLASVRAFGGATTAQLQQVADQATELSNRFGVSAASVVEATSLFTKAGGTVQDAINGATEAIVKLQVASQGELTAAQAATVTSAALKQFNLTGDQAGRVADNLAAALQGSALSALGVQQAFIQAAPGAAALGLSIEDVSAGVALVGDQLVKGTITGTAFKQFLLDIIKPSKEAQQVFSKYGIAIQDATGNALPFIDILGNLHDKLADVTPLQREQALATIFGSRAFLAATIFTNEGADGLQRYREELAKTTTSNIVDVLLLPMEKQLERVRVAAENAGRAFGGPLLAPVRTAANQIVDFLQGVAPLAQLAGEAIAVVLTQQGFGALQTKIDQLVGHNALSAFLIELVNTARNVADVVTSQIIPAINIFFQTLASAGQQSSTLDAMGQGFDKVNQAIQNIGANVAAGIVAIGQLTVEFIKGEGAGGRLRDTIEKLATAIVTNLAAGFSTAVITIQAAITALPILARISLLTAQAVLKVSGALDKVAIAANNIGAGAQVGILTQQALEVQTSNPKRAEELLNQAAAVKAGAEKANKAIEDETNEARALAASIQTDVDNLGNLTKGFDALGPVSAENARIARTSVEDLANELIQASGINVDLLTQDDVNSFIERAGAMKQAAVGAVNPFLQVFEDAKGQISTALDNVNATIEEHSRQAAERGGGAAGVVSVDQGTVDKELAKIDNSFRRLATQIDHTARDAQTKVDEAVRSSLERIDDIVTNAIDRLKQIERDRQEAINDLRTNTAQARADRAATTAFQQSQEDQLTIKQRELDKEATEEQRTLDRIRTARQQHNEDLATLYQQNTEDVEKAKQREIDLNERAFSIIQQAQDTAFSRSQETALTAFQRSQQAAADARSFAKQLAGAKTPAEAAQLIDQHRQSLEDTRFQQGQEDALTKFRNKQEDARTTFQNQQSLAALQFRQAQEDVFTKFRRDNEKKFQDYRRGVEAFEKFLENAEDDVLLKHRQGNEDELTAYRRQQAIDFQAFQDKLEDEANQRRIDRINRESGEQAQKAVVAAKKQLTEIGDALTLNLGKQADQLDNQLQNVIDQADNLRDSLKESLPPDVFNAVLPRIDALTSSLRGAANSAKADFKQAQDQAQETIDAAVAVGQAQVEVAASPTINATQQVTTPTQVIAVQSIQAANIVLPPGFTQGVAAAVQLGISQAVDQGILPNDFNIDLTPLEQGVESIRRGLRA